MSVLMRGVQMPKNCEECNFKGECRDYWEKIREAYTRPSWCPLVEVAEQTEPTTEEGSTVIQTYTACCSKGKWRATDENTCEKCLYYMNGVGCQNQEMYHTDCQWK